MHLGRDDTNLLIAYVFAPVAIGDVSVVFDCTHISSPTSLSLSVIRRGGSELYLLCSSRGNGGDNWEVF